MSKRIRPAPVGPSAAWKPPALHPPQLAQLPTYRRAGSGRVYVVRDLGRSCRYDRDVLAEDIFEVTVGGERVGRIGHAPNYYGPDRPWVIEIGPLLRRERQNGFNPDEGVAFARSCDGGPHHTFAAAVSEFVRRAEWVTSHGLIWEAA